MAFVSLLEHSGNGGSNGTVPTVANSGGLSGTPMSQAPSIPAGTTLTWVTNTTTISGGVIYKFVTTGTTTGFVFFTMTSANEYTFRIGVDPSALGTGGNVLWRWFTDPAYTTTGLTLGWNSIGQLTLQEAALTVVTSGATTGNRMVAGTAYEIRGGYNASGANVAGNPAATGHAYAALYAIGASGTIIQATDLTLTGSASMQSMRIGVGTTSFSGNVQAKMIGVGTGGAITPLDTAVSTAAVRALVAVDPNPPGVVGTVTGVAAVLPPTVQVAALFPPTVRGYRTVNGGAPGHVTVAAIPPTVGGAVVAPDYDHLSIEASARSLAYYATFNGVSVEVESFQCSREVVDIPDQLAIFEGIAGGQIELTISRAYAARLSPFVSTSPLGQINAPASVGVQFSYQGVPRTVWPLLTGVVTDVQFQTTGDAVVTIQDLSANLQGTFSCGLGAVVHAVNSSGVDYDNGYSTLAVIEAALRGGGVYLTPPPAIADAAIRAQRQLVSASGYGGVLPDVGSIISNLGHYGRTAGQFCPDMWDLTNSGGSVDVRPAIDITKTSFAALEADTWVRQPNVSGDIVRLGDFDSFSLTYDGAGNALAIAILCNGTVNPFVSTPIPQDGHPHYMRAWITAKNGSGVSEIGVQVDGVSNTVTGFTTPGRFAFSQYTSNVCRLGTGEALEVRAVLSSLTTPALIDRHTWTAGVPSHVTTTKARLRAIAAHDGLSQWGTVTDVCQAEGAAAWFDTDGSFIFEPKTVWDQRKAAPAVDSYTLDEMNNIPVRSNALGLRGSVSGNYTGWETAESTRETPCWAADANITAPPGTSVQKVATDLRFQNVYQPDPTVDQSPPGGNDVRSHFIAIRSNSVGDPAAKPLTNVTVSVRPTIDGFDLTVVNRNAFAVTFYNPAGGGAPYLILHGTRVYQTPVITITAPASPLVQTPLALADIEWRQDAAITGQLVWSTASSVHSVRPTLGPVTVPGDPRRKLGDVVMVSDGVTIPQPVRCVIVGIASTGGPSDPFTMALMLRPVSTPGYWALGIPGMSELGVTTVLG